MAPCNRSETLPEFAPPKNKERRARHTHGCRNQKVLYKRPHAAWLALQTPAGSWLANRRFTGLKNAASEGIDRSGVASSDLLIPESRSRLERSLSPWPRKVHVLATGLGSVRREQLDATGAVLPNWALVPYAAA